ncbi:MAG: EamA family transporter, partial [Oscillospiraceae bacterium]|nr:EamA family transporter [Oscillospiraceae bacterium]
MWRMIAAWIGLLVLLTLTHNIKTAKNLLIEFKTNRKLLLGYLATAPMLIYQQWLFMWAPVNNYGLDAALGYFIFPLALVAVGRVFFKERMNRFQIVAVVLALIGVCYEIWYTKAISWVTFSVFLGYAYYLGYRRALSIHPLVGLFFDVSLSLPLAIGYLILHPQSFEYVIHSPYSQVMLLALGALTAISMNFIMMSTKL